jgi:benzoyl-CoA reductase/2-hydroxyglutaryl-CoA dehydratase subunit BcrC/BadD/HgdB
MTPNQRRLGAISHLIDKFKPDAVVDVVLQSCHSYNIESYKVERHVKSLGLKFLKLETDYSAGDKERIRVRIRRCWRCVPVDQIDRTR